MDGGGGARGEASSLKFRVSCSKFEVRGLRLCVGLALCAFLPWRLCGIDGSDVGSKL